jgi:hypothetical protein
MEGVKSNYHLIQVQLVIITQEATDKVKSLL